MTRIDQHSSDAARPYLNLLPIVEFLVGLGNVALDEGFITNPDGWRCRLQDPIDFEEVRSKFEIPTSINLSESHDTILDTLSWCSIEGPGTQPS